MGLAEFHVKVCPGTGVTPPALVPVATYCCVWPTVTVAVGGITATVAMVGVVTVTVAAMVFCWMGSLPTTRKCALIGPPIVMPRTRPDASIVATVGSRLEKTAVYGRHGAVPTAFAVRRAVSPRSTVVAAGTIATADQTQLAGTTVPVGLAPRSGSHCFAVQAGRARIKNRMNGAADRRRGRGRLSSADGKSLCIAKTISAEWRPRQQEVAGQTGPLTSRRESGHAMPHPLT